MSTDRRLRDTKDLDEAGFSASTLVHDASIRNFEIIGEACRRIRRDHPSFAERHPDLPLVSAYAMRNWLAHGYFDVRLKTVWETITDDLPEMKRHVEAMLRELKDETDG